MRRLSPQQQEVLRKRVMAAVGDGMSTAEAVRVFGVSRGSVRNWRARFDTGGAAGLSSGTPGRRDGEQTKLSASEAWALVESIIDSLQRVTSDDRMREICFVKTALFKLSRAETERIDPHAPHPLHMERLMSDSALHCNAVFPLRNVSLEERFGEAGAVYRSIREIVRDILREEHGGLLHDALKWLLYKQWESSDEPSPGVECPHCDNLTGGLPHGVDETQCPNLRCGEPVYITDVPGLHLDMNEESARDTVASAYMAIHEMLLLVSFIQHCWERGDFATLENTLLVKDGPLMFPRQYAKLTRRLRELLEYAKRQGVTIHLMGQEKSGMLFDHLEDERRALHAGQETKWPQTAILSHRYIREKVQRAPQMENLYGKRTNYGEKILVRLDSNFSLVLNIPTGQYLDELEKPSHPEDFIGFHRIVATLPHLVSYLHEGSLAPIDLAHGIASLSDYPSTQTLKLFSGLGEPVPD
ncbi:helix-turn-helix domain-containing protein [Glycomyces tenuis]|uniref:helix-turn-helix domain-containing protein n=1 Tax=Glycomyces tenuis TaxID=58116 RepID=UPI0012DEE7EC|nr:helix-turn-helix domain-containing protein [Glycomyces tenuis]